MDWPLDDPKFDDGDVEDLFEYEPRESRVVRCLGDRENFTQCVLKSEQEWTAWLEKGLSPCVEGIQPGLGVILAGRAEEDHGHNSAILEYLPFSQNTFAQIASKLPIHGDMARIISRSDACFFSETNLVDFNAGVIFYSCRTSSTWPNDLAVSSSFNPKTGFTTALVLGCDKNLMESISTRIYNSESTSTHPLLIMGILAEIERERHTELVRNKVFHLLKRVYAMSNTGQISATSTLRKENYSVDLWIKLSQLRIGLESWKMQLQKMITSIDEFEQRILCVQSCDQRPEKEDDKNDTWKPTCKRAGQRIKKRLLEIVCDYDEKIRECTMVIDGMTLATHLSWNQIGYQNAQANLRIASDTKNDSSQMKSIALLTMVFLPATFVSSLFSMTFFNWYPQNGQGILSPYVWIYPVVTICITLVVVGIWYIFTKKCRVPSKDESIV